MWYPLMSAFVVTGLVFILMLGFGITTTRADVIIAPIRFWGDFTYTQQFEDYESTEDQEQKIATVKLNADTFVWQPWFLQVNGGIGLSYSETNREIRGESSGEYVTGNLGLKFLPQSRFPLAMYYKRSDSRLSGEAIGSIPYRNTRYGIVQKYRNRSGSTAMQAAYDHNIQQAEGEADDISKVLSFDMQQNYDKNSLNYKASNERAYRRHLESSSYDRKYFSVRHGYKPDFEYSMENMLTLDDTEDQTTVFRNNIRRLQLASNSFWRPKDKPWTGYMNGRYYSTLTEQGMSSSDAELLNLSGGANYSFTRHLRMYGAVSANQSKNDSQETLTSTQTLGISYTPAQIKLGKYTYNWNTSGNVVNRSGGNNSGQNMNASLGHALQRAFVLDPSETISASVSQNASANYDTKTGAESKRMGHSGILTWSRSRDNRSMVNARFTLSDSRTVATDPYTITQLINLQVNGNQEINYVSSWSGNFSIQSSRHLTPTTEDRKFNTTSSANIKYRHIRAFDVPRLRFTSSLRIERQLSEPKRNTLRRNQKTWSNRFNYAIGRLFLELNFQMVEFSNKEKAKVLMFSLQRVFGS